MFNPELFNLASKASQYIFEKYQHTYKPSFLKKDATLKNYLKNISTLLTGVTQVHAATGQKQAQPKKTYKAITWNLERGKNLGAIIKSLKEHMALADADFILLTEVDWGMIRTNNLNITLEIAKAVDYHAYFAPSFFNLSRGHGSAEADMEGQNLYGLHGKAILSRYPLENLRSLALPNLTNPLRKKEPRIGYKNVLLSEYDNVTFACVHLDCYSSPRSRTRQMRTLIKSLANTKRALIAGDWNTNTHNTTHAAGLFLSVTKQLIQGPQRAVQKKYAHTQKYYDKPLFKFLAKHQFDIDTFNEIGASTFDLYIDAEELGDMAKDRMPQVFLKMLNRLIKHCGGHIPLKLDWFAGRGLTAQNAKVIKLPKEYHDNNHPPSDHHPVIVEFTT
ncbi:MAG: endonuclease/exonuclease/phosphatase [uncultured bacterium]|nr:MAG: endonuclease/exonuclease/phosphatase [uncultured bacterium]